MTVALAVATAGVASGGAQAPEDLNMAAAFAELGVTDADMTHILDNTFEVVDPVYFKFAASLDPPTIDPTQEPWAAVARIGLTMAVWTDPTTIPSLPSEATINGVLRIPSGSGIVADTEYLVLWAQMNGLIPIDGSSPLLQNWSFPISVPGQPTWNPLDQFPRDTWGGASHIPFATGPDPWFFGMSVVQPDGSLSAMPFDGVFIIRGDTIIAVTNRDAVSQSGLDGLTYSFASHVSDQARGATPESQSLVGYATGEPGSLVGPPLPSTLMVGQTQPPPPPTTTQPPETTITTVQSSTPTTLAEAGPPGDDEGASAEGDNFPWLTMLFALAGLILVVIGGRLFIIRKEDPCKELLLAWQKAQNACDEARAKAKEAKQDCDMATQKQADLEKQISDICTRWPPACEGEGSWAEESGQPDTRVTSRDQHARRIALGRVWDDYQAGNITAQEVEQKWQEADTPEFREEMRKKTQENVAERGNLEKQLEKAKFDAKEKCDKAAQAQKAADAACDEAEKAKKAYDDCVAEQNAGEFVDALMGLGSDSEGNPDATDTVTSDAGSAAVTTTEPGAAGTADPLAGRRVDVAVPTVIDKTGLTGSELTRAEKLEVIFTSFRGTGDIAGVAEELYAFNNWHQLMFGEPYYKWTTDGGSTNSPTSTSRTSQDFMQTREMACYEFVHFCAYIASDQLGRQRIDGDDDSEWLSDDYSVDWGFADEINTNTSPLTGQAPRGSVITGSFRWGDYDNRAGYYHTGVSIGRGQIISLGSDGLVREDATGAVGGCFPSAGYTNVQYGDYSYGTLNPAPQSPTQ